MKQTISLEKWLEGNRSRSPAKRKDYNGVTIQTACDMTEKSRVTIWKWLINGKLDAWRIVDAGGREVAVIVTQASLERVCDVYDEYSRQMLIDL